MEAEWTWKHSVRCYFIGIKKLFTNFLVRIKIHDFYTKNLKPNQEFRYRRTLCRRKSKTRQEEETLCSMQGGRGFYRANIFVRMWAISLHHKTKKTKNVIPNNVRSSVKRGIAAVVDAKIKPTQISIFVFPRLLAKNHLQQGGNNNDPCTSCSASNAFSHGGASTRSRRGAFWAGFFEEMKVRVCFSRFLYKPWITFFFFDPFPCKSSVQAFWNFL